MNRSQINAFINRLPVHLILIGLCLIWLVPTIGLLVTSIRPFQSVNTTGWWTALSPPPGAQEYNQYCASCHGLDGNDVAEADLTNVELVSEYPRSLQLLAMLWRDDSPHPEIELPEPQAAAAITTQMRRFAGLEEAPSNFTMNNYTDALVGYRGTSTYSEECASGTPPSGFSCTFSDILNPRGMGRAFVNSLIVTLPATFLPIIFAAFAAYAFSWLDFKGRQLLFAILVGLQVVPLQMTLVPISRFYAELGLNGTFLGVWLFHSL